MRVLFLQDEEVGAHSVKGPAAPVNTLAHTVCASAVPNSTPRLDGGESAP